MLSLFLNNTNFKIAITFSDDLLGYQFLQILHPQGTLFNSPKLHLLEHFGLIICNLAPCGQLLFGSKRRQSNKQ